MNHRKTTQWSSRHPPDTVDVLDGVTDLPTHFFLVALHLKEPGRREAGGKKQSDGQTVRFGRLSVRRYSKGIKQATAYCANTPPDLGGRFLVCEFEKGPDSGRGSRPALKC